MVRAFRARSAVVGHQIPCLSEQPAFTNGHPHMFNLPEVAALLRLPEVCNIILDQCMFDSVYMKATSFRGNVSIDEQRCNYARQWWCAPWSGKAYEAPHPHLFGRQLAIPWSSWS